MKLAAFLLLCIGSILASPTQKLIQSRLRASGGRIIGGEQAYTGQFPFAAAIYLSTSVGRYFCGGALLNTQWILTAGQCVDGAVRFDIYLGSIYISRSDPDRIIIQSTESTLHPDYSQFPDIDNDIGLIRLPEAIEYSNYIRPVDLIAQSDLGSSLTVRAVGWGQISNDEPAPVDALNFVVLTTISNDECALTFGGQITESMGCIAGNFNEGICIGDTGSPLVQLGSLGPATHVGVASWYSQSGCNSADPSGFTRTFPFKDWISNVTSV